MDERRSSSDVRVRLATEADALPIRDVFESAYGASYTYPEFYDEYQLKKLIFGDDTLVLVAESLDTGTVVGTASVILEAGALSDLVGEFGRLVVRPEARGRGIGAKLLQSRLDRVQSRLHVGIMEARVVHPYSVMNAHSHGFAPVGLLPSKLSFGGEREHTALQARYFGEGLALRRNHPRLVPEAYRLAETALENTGVGSDVIVDEESAPYPPGASFDVQELTESGYSTLLRIERGRLRNREVFGPLRLHYGFFKLTTTRSCYLIAREGERIVGAIGYTFDDREGGIRVFELIHLDDGVVRFLVQELERLCRERRDVHWLEIDVSAHAPRMQRTLIELGYLPAAYVPALAFHRVERMDVVKMVRLVQDVSLERPDLPSPTREVADLVLDMFVQQAVLPKIGTNVERVSIFRGLTEEQQRRLASTFDYETFEAGSNIFQPGSASDEMYVILSGRVAIELDDRRVGQVGTGECLGEIALMSDRVHSARARALDSTEAGVFTRTALRELVRRRPDIGVVLYRNLAKELGRKLLRSDRDQAARANPPQV